jgi:hypothetical protein
LWCGSRRHFEKKISGGDPMIKDVAFTVYPVRDLAQVHRFYEKDLGLNVTMVFENAWVEYTLPNGTFALTTMDVLLADAVSLVSRNRKK